MSPSTSTDVPEPDYAQAIGRTESKETHIAPERVDAMAKTLDLATVTEEGNTLPPGWHWLFFNPFARRSELGPDGHPKRGGFLPNVDLPRRMWAGGRLVYRKPLVVGARTSRESEILNVKEKSGKGGQLVFVTVKHWIKQDGTVCIEEEQDIVYREAPSPDAPKPKYTPAPQGAAWSETVEPDPVLLFRYSALTSNGHRIHYDRPYAVEEEGYHDLVVHGPLTATLLQDLATRCNPERKLSHFSFRGMAPLFVDRPFHVEAKSGEDEGSLDLWARGPDGELAMQASAVF